MKIAGRTSAEIFDSVRALAQNGQLPPGHALPPVRELAALLDVNRNTVASAYKRLVAAGIAVTQGRLGTLIRTHEGPGEQEGALPGSPLVDLASGNPNPHWLPDVATVLRTRPSRPRLYGEDLINPELEAFAHTWCADDCPGEFALDLTHGAVDAVERLLSAHLAPGDKVAVEDPCFLSSINTLRNAGLHALGVAVDAEGMRAEALEASLAQGAQAVILTPRAHNPTGCSLSAARADALRSVLECYPHVLVVVDDHFGLVAQADYHSVLSPALQRWALVRSVSKGLGPDLRLAFVACDVQTSRRLRLRLATGTTWVSHILQDIVQGCLADAQWTQQLQGAGQDYARRRGILRQALLDEGIVAVGPADGLNMWVPVPAGGHAIGAALARYGWLVRTGESFGVRSPAQGVRITVSTLEQEQAIRFAADLRRVMSGTR